jgi:hypothetical protein
LPEEQLQLEEEFQGIEDSLFHALSYASHEYTHDSKYDHMAL